MATHVVSLLWRVCPRTPIALPRFVFAISSSKTETNRTAILVLPEELGIRLDVAGCLGTTDAYRNPISGNGQKKIRWVLTKAVLVP